MITLVTLDPWFCVPGFRRVCLFRSCLAVYTINSFLQTLQETMEPSGDCCGTARALPLAAAFTTDHLILLRVVTIIGFDPGADALDLVPHAVVHEVALVALIGELDLELADIRLERADSCDICREGCR